jgi:hypothetical protein
MKQFPLPKISEWIEQASEQSSPDDDGSDVEPQESEVEQDGSDEHSGEEEHSGDDDGVPMETENSPKKKLPTISIRKRPNNDDQPTARPPNRDRPTIDGTRNIDRGGIRGSPDGAIRGVLNPDGTFGELIREEPFDPRNPGTTTEWYNVNTTRRPISDRPRPPNRDRSPIDPTDHVSGPYFKGPYHTEGTCGTLIPGAGPKKKVIPGINTRAEVDEACGAIFSPSPSIPIPSTTSHRAPRDPPNRAPRDPTDDLYNTTRTGSLPKKNQLYETPLPSTLVKQPVRSAPTGKSRETPIAIDFGNKHRGRDRSLSRDPRETSRSSTPSHGSRGRHSPRHRKPSTKRPREEEELANILSEREVDDYLSDDLFDQEIYAKRYAKKMIAERTNQP